VSQYAQLMQGEVSAKNKSSGLEVVVKFP
jgi:hypothetical protein